MVYRGKILAVDDTPESLRLLTDILKAEGYDVLSAINGEIALRAAFFHAPSLILLDIRMQGIDGFEVCRQLKAQTETQAIPVIFLSAISDSAEKVKGFELGAVDFVSKPYQRDELLIRVRTHLELSHLRHHFQELLEQRTAALLKSQAALQESQSRLALFIEHSPVAIAMFDREMCYLAASRQWINEFLPDGSEVIGKNHYEIFPVVKEGWREAHRRGLAGEVVQCEEDFYTTSQGQQRCFRWAVHPWSMPEADNAVVAGIIIFSEDITERKATELALRKLSRVVEQSPESIVITDLEACVEYVNTAFSRNSGFTDEDIIGKKISVIKSNKTPVATYKALWQRLNQGEVWEGELINKHKDGREFIDYTLIMPIKDAQGVTTHYAAIQEDVTEKKQLNAELEQYRDHLENLVKQRTAELDQAKSGAEAANSAKSDFLSNMSHEIRTPMNAVLGFCYLLEQQGLSDEARELVYKIHGSGRTLLAIINDILDFSKIEAGRLDIEAHPFHLNVVIDNLAALMTASACSRHKQLELVIIPPLYTHAVIGDEMRLQQVLVNLVSNAIKFTEHGEVVLRIMLQAEQEDQVRLRFSVRDTGIGISTQQQQAIFDAFSQADTSISRRFGGTGLGLAISQRLVGLMGGSLQLSSELGGGSEFWFELTLPRQLDATHDWSDLTELELLIVDDSATARAALEQSALSLGWCADLVDSGEAAMLKVLAKLCAPYDVLLLDWKMPGMDGLATVQALRQALAQHPNAPGKLPVILMVTAYAQDELRTQPGIEYVDGLLNKPVTPSSLYDAVSKLLIVPKPEHEATLSYSEVSLSQYIRGLRVLVVDDSEINLEVAKRILTAEGAIVSQARDGQEALDWLMVHDGDIDLILMDVQMPRLDGYATTREIRRNPKWRTLPVIALTAGAFKSLEVAALDAGMNDFIAKPFDVEILLQKIHHWARQVEGALTPVDNGALPQSPVTEGNLPILPGIDRSAGAKIWRDVAVYRSYLLQFVTQYQNVGEEFITLVRQGQLQTAMALAHKLKGSASSLALTTVAEESFAVEVALKQGDAILPVAESLQNALRQVVNSLESWPAPVSITPSSNLEVPSEQGVNRETITGLLNKLLAALDEDNPSHTKALISELEALLGVETLAAVKTLIMEFDFRQAEALTRQLLADLQA